MSTVVLFEATGDASVMLCDPGMCLIWTPMCGIDQTIIATLSWRESWLSAAVEEEEEEEEEVEEEDEEEEEEEEQTFETIVTRSYSYSYRAK